MPLDGTTYQVQHPSLEGLIAWLETQDPETEYDYMDTCHCLAATYFRSLGRAYSAWCLAVDPPVTATDHARSQIERVACHSPHIYGAALQRARALL